MAETFDVTGQLTLVPTGGSPPPIDPPPIDPPPIDPPPIDPPPSTAPCRHPNFPGVTDGKCAVLGDSELYHVTRELQKGDRFCRNTDEGEAEFEISYNNASATYMGEQFVDRVFVEFDVWYNEDIIAEIGGGNHFHQISGWWANRMNDDPYIRVEWANIGKTTGSGGEQPFRVIVHNYKQDDGPVSQSWNLPHLDPKILPNEWFHWEMWADYDEDLGRLELGFEVNDFGKEEQTFMVVPGSRGPGGYLSLLGHVGPQKGFCRFRNVDWRRNR